MRSDLLHVIAAVANPVRWQSRIRLAGEFIEHMLDSGVQVTIVSLSTQSDGFSAVFDHGI